MTLKELFSELVSGTPVKRKCWKGYWKYSYGVLNMHTKDGRIVNIKDSEDVLFTISGMLADDWEIATEDNSVVLRSENAANT